MGHMYYMYVHMSCTYIFCMIVNNTRDSRTCVVHKNQKKNELNIESMGAKYIRCHL